MVMLGTARVQKPHPPAFQNVSLWGAANEKTTVPTGGEPLISSTEDGGNKAQYCESGFETKSGKSA